MKTVLSFSIVLLSLLLSSCSSTRLQTNAYVKTPEPIKADTYNVEVSADRSSLKDALKEYVLSEFSRAVKMDEKAVAKVKVIFTSDLEVSGSSVGVGFYRYPFGVSNSHDVSSSRRTEMIVKLVDKNGKTLWDATHNNFGRSDHEAARESVKIIVDRLLLEMSTPDMSGKIEEEKK